MGASTAETDPPIACAPVPRGQKRRSEIAAVARDVFFENGFADTTMQAIAARAGASKETLYRHFGSKEGLFAEIVAARAESFLGRLDEDFDTPGSVADVLTSVGTRLLEALLCDEAVSLCRTVVSESIRTPELGEIFLRAGPRHVRSRLAAFLDAARARGEFDCRDCAAAARIFLGAVMGSFHLECVVSANARRLGAAERDAHVAEIVAMFMDRYAR